MAIGARAIAQSAVGNVIGSMAAPDHTSVVALFNSSLISAAEATMQAAGPVCLSATAAYMLLYADAVDGFGLMRKWQCQLTQATPGGFLQLAEPQLLRTNPAPVQAAAAAAPGTNSRFNYHQQSAAGCRATPQAAAVVVQPIADCHSAASWAVS
jgi:hypothetical protein